MVFVPAQDLSVTDCEHSFNYLTLLISGHCKDYLKKEFCLDKVRLRV